MSNDSLRLYSNFLAVELCQKYLWSLNGLERLPKDLTRIIDRAMWRERRQEDGRTFTFATFAQFVTAPPMAGLDSTIDVLRRLCAHSPEAIDAIDRALAADAVGHRPTVGDAPMTGAERVRRTRALSNESLDNIKPFVTSDAKVKDGTSAEYGLRRLRSSAPELHARVLAGELSTHAAMREAGFRPRTATVRVDDPPLIAKTLRRCMAPDAIRVLAELLSTPAD